MYRPLRPLIDRQRCRKLADEDLASRLEPSRTVWLNDLIDGSTSAACASFLAATGLDVARFVARLAAACAWLNGVAHIGDVRGIEGIPLVFFQPVDPDEDEACHQALLDEEANKPPSLQLYTARYATLPTGVHYLPVHTKKSWSFVGSYACGNLTLMPGIAYFCNAGMRYVMDSTGDHNSFGTMLGYRVPDYAALLNVGPEVATDVFARIVVHDLCHFALPRTPPVVEGYHNVASLVAMGRLPAPPYGSAWERCVHLESIDPGFCLNAEEEISAVERSLGVLSPIQDDVLAGFRRWYLSERARAKRERWGLSTEGDALPALLQHIEASCADGFAIYGRHASAD